MDATPQPPSAIHFFEPDGPYGWLCALSPHPVVADGLTWPTAEHYYQALKFPVDPALQVEIAATPDPFLAKAIARRERHRRPADWHPDKALAAFRTAMRLKFAQHPELAAALQATGTAELIESSPDDDYWGSGPNGMGQNWVGRILMDLRDARH